MRPRKLNRLVNLAASALALLPFAACSRQVAEIDTYPDIFPDYVGVTVPRTVAPLGLRMADGRKAKTEVKMVGDTMWISVSSRNGKVMENYRPFPVYVSSDAIDPYVAYRLIEPGYESWREISICARELSSYTENVILRNSSVADGCVNCHSFAAGNADKMMLHVRGAGGGTLIMDGDDVRMLNIAGIGPRKQGSYPAWHPEGRYIAFSSNTTQQMFTVNCEQPIEVYDTASDIILLDTQTDSVLAYPPLNDEGSLETFPSWSEDGSVLYYCAADPVTDYERQRGDVRYRLMAVAFKDGTFVGEPWTVFDDPAISVSFPRVNGDWMMFTASAFGTFPIWHEEADLWMLNLKTGESLPAEALNSDRTESYHSWSSNGKWVVFSSRVLDGRYTRLFIAHYMGDGTFDKPFLLPQEDPDHNILRLKSYNIPEFVTSEPKNLDAEAGGLIR